MKEGEFVHGLLFGGYGRIAFIHRTIRTSLFTTFDDPESTLILHVGNWVYSIEAAHSFSLIADFCLMVKIIIYVLSDVTGLWLSWH